MDYGKQHHEHVLAYIVWCFNTIRVPPEIKKTRVSREWVRSWYGRET